MCNKCFVFSLLINLTKNTTTRISFCFPLCFLYIPDALYIKLLVVKFITFKHGKLCNDWVFPYPMFTIRI